MKRVSISIWFLTAALFGSAKAGDDAVARAMNHLGAGEYEKAFAALKLAAMRGHVRAQAQLGALFMDGLGVPQDPVRAASLFEGAALAGDADGQFQLGLVFLNGDGVLRNDEKAEYWLLRAAEQGHRGAQFNLALFYEAGRAGADKKDNAIGWMRAAAEAGLPEAMTAMGLMVHKSGDASGPGAADWFQKAAEAGDAQGQFFYAVALVEGDGREKDVAAAKQWVFMALEGERLNPESRRDAEAFLKSL